MKDFFKKIGIVEDKNEEDGANKNVVPSQPQISLNPIPTTPIYNSSEKVEDPEIRQRIFTIFEDYKKKSGVTIDYLDFKKALDNMKNNSLSENDKFKAIFDVLNSTTDLSQVTLATSLQNYLNIISIEKKQFETVVAKQLEMKVSSINSKIENEKKLAEETKVEIQKLQERLSLSEVSITQLNKELNNVNESANQQSIAFINTLSIVSAELEKENQIIKNL